MVDSHQVLIENCNRNVTSNGDNSEPNLIVNAIPMNEIYSERSSDLNGSCSNLETVENNYEQNGENSQGKLDDDGEIMCDLSPKREPSNNDGPNCTTNAIQQPRTVTSNGDAANLIITTITNNDSQIVATKHDASIVNGNQQKISKSIDLNKHNRKATTSTTDQLRAHENSAEFQSNVILSVENKITNKMDSRKVEPIRININRDPIKTKIKLGPSSHDCQTVSLKSASSSSSSSSSNNDDECDNISGMATHENTQSYPKITIKPIIKPAMNHHNNQNAAGLQASSSSSASHEAIPKLKIKKIESSSSSSSSSTANNQTPKPTLVAALNSDEITTNYQTHLLSESSTTVPT